MHTASRDDDFRFGESYVNLIVDETDNAREKESRKKAPLALDNRGVRALPAVTT